MAMLYRLMLLALPLAVNVTPASARLGETEREMFARFGPPTSSSKHSMVSQGRVHEVGPSFSFQQDGWRIRADVVDGRCVRISYAKTGDWTEEQVQLVLNANSQGAAWTETGRPGARKVQRTWQRSDGAQAHWSGVGMQLVTPAYDRAKQVIEAKAKAASGQKPRI